MNMPHARKGPNGPPRWLLAGLVLVTGAYFQMYPVIRFGAADTAAPLTGLEQFANLLLAAAVATFVFVALRALSAAIEARQR